MFLKEMCDISVPSSYENKMINFLKEKLKGYNYEINIDNIGNVIVHKKGQGKKVVVNVPMDEGGFIITGYNDDGTLKFTSISSINNVILPCKSIIIGDKNIPGVIGFKPIHLQDKEYRQKKIEIDKLSIDIGAKDKNEARKTVSIGEYAVFNNNFSYLGKNLIKGRGLDSKISCEILFEILKEDYNLDFYGVFSVQSKVGFRGGLISAYNIQPNICLCIQGIELNSLDKGPLISTMNGNTIMDTDIYNAIKDLCKVKNIPYQNQQNTLKEDNTNSYNINGKTSKVASISIPCKYINSPRVICSIKDVENIIKLVKEYLKNL